MIPDRYELGWDSTHFFGGIPFVDSGKCNNTNFDNQ